MESKVAAFAATPDPTFGQQKPVVSPDTGAPDRTAPTPDQVELRLVIEKDPTSGSYVYKTIDRRTGEVLQQLPREELLRLREEAAYAAGDVIRTQA
jgi:flagellar protein FlaG